MRLSEPPQSWSRVLSAVRARGRAGPAELSQDTNLALPAVAEITDALVGAQLLERHDSRGLWSTDASPLFSLNHNLGYFLGIDVHPSSLRARLNLL